MTTNPAPHACEQFARKRPADGGCGGDTMELNAPNRNTGVW